MNHRVRAAAGLLLAALLTACSPAPEPSKPPVPGVSIEGQTILFPKDSPQLATIRVVPALPERESFVRINGRIAWDESRTSRVHVPVAGRVTELRAAPGDAVARGGLLAVISSPDFGQTQAEARRAETDLALSERTLARTRELQQAGVVPTKDLQAAEADHARARAERDRTAARERLYGSARSIDQMYRLTAPVPGVVVDRHVNLGQEVRADQAPEAPLFLISDPTRLWVLLDVPESLAREVTVGESVRLAVPALPGEKFAAQVEYVADFIDPQTRMVRARAALENRARKLKAEMYVTAEIAVPPSQALRVPGIGLFLLEDRFYAFVEESPGRFTRRQVQAEEATLGFMRVISGLSAGDKVVADGALLLQQLLTQKATAPSKSARDPAGNAGN